VNRACPACGAESPNEFAFCPRCGAALAEPPAARELRKTVTVVFSDVTGSTALGERLDPEPLRRLLLRWYGAMREVCEAHGGKVRELIGDAVMAAFGIPAVHEDDALRAVRAAAGMRERLDELNGELEREFGVKLQSRTGVNTGEVIVHDPDPSGALALGDPVNVAARLQTAAEPGEILLGEATYRLVQDAARADPVEPLALKGKTESVTAYRLHEVLPHAEAVARHFETPLVGRQLELAQLHQAYERAKRERRSHLVTVFGLAGIGKTRLAQELARSVEHEAAVLTGRCLSYGEGITYWPLREIVPQATGVRPVRALLGDDPDAQAIAERLESAVGSGTTGAVGEEVFWAVRKLAEALARERPLVLVFEDIHWGEPTLLDLIEHLADWIRDVPVLVVCLARPELLDERPTWGGGKLNATSILLEPLSREESSMLIRTLAGTELSPETGDRIAVAAEGNPLFLEQMLAMLAESENGVAEIAVPPAIQALLSARLDRLTPDERQVIECASVEGEVFHVGGVVELSSPRTREAVRSQLTSLVRKELIRPELPALPGEEAFGFRHALIRDAAYASLPKEARSDFHERHARWLELTFQDRATEADEFLAYHLEQAHRYRVELGIAGEATDALAARAGGLFASAGRRAFMRGDWPATVNLFERGLALLGEGSALRRELMPDLALALFQMGNTERADGVAAHAIAAAEAAGDLALRARAAVTHTYFGFFLRPEQLDVDFMRWEAEQAFALFDELDDNVGRTRAIFNLDMAEWASGSADGTARSAERAIGYARRAGIRPDELECCGGFGWSMWFGTTPAGLARRRIEEVVLGAGRDRSLEALAATFFAVLDGAEDRLGEAQERMEQGRHALAELGLHRWVWISSVLASHLAMLAADFAVAERVLREVLDLPRASAHRLFNATAEVELVRAVHAQGRHDDAFALTEAIEAVPPLADPYVRTRRRGARALALGSIGRLDEAEALARDAVELSRQSDFLNIRGDTLVDLAGILRLCGRPAESAATALEEAVALYERKGNVVSAARARALIEELTA
jgi:class 3 adenylate cyclase/tetratricopeptide (TPR) repeat protein